MKKIEPERISAEDLIVTDPTLYHCLGSPVFLGQTLACVYLMSELMPLLNRLGVRGVDETKNALDAASASVRERLRNLPKAYEETNVKKTQEIADETIELWRGRLRRG